MNLRVFLRRFALLVLFTLLLLTLGTVGFLQQGWSLSDALYMTVITITAVGYQEVRPLTEAGRLLAAGLLAGGITAMGFWFALLTAVIVEIDLTHVLRTRKLMKRIQRLSDHVIVCGAGRTGRQVVRELVAAGRPYVVIEREEDRAELIREIDRDAPILVEDATRDETLEEAGIERAGGLVAALSADTDNVYVCLTARARGAGLNIVARALDGGAASKLYKAGADHCVSPRVTGGMRMAAMLLRPRVVSFLDVIMSGEELSLRLEEVDVPEGSPLAGQTLEEAAIPSKTGLIVIAISRREVAEQGRLVYNPGPDERLGAADVLIVLGSPDQVDGLRAIARA